MKEAKVLFNNALHTFDLWLYGVGELGDTGNTLPSLSEPVFLIRPGQVRSGQVRSECLSAHSEQLL